MGGCSTSATSVNEPLVGGLRGLSSASLEGSFGRVEDAQRGIEGGNPW